MDNVDYAILCQLQEDARIANNELASRVGLSPSPCLRRVRALEREGVISGYSALINRDSVNCGYEPLVWVTLSTVQRDVMVDFEDAVERVPQIVEVLRMMGQPDYLLRIVTRDANSFETLYFDVLADLPHVQTLTSQLAMKIVKRTSQLPIGAG